MTSQPHPLVLRGREALARNDLPAVAAAAEERLKVEARDVDALELRYLVQQRRGEGAQAAETIKAAMAVGADWAFNELIQHFLAKGRRADAEQLARTALRTNPRNARAHALFGTLLSELNDLPAGEWHFRRAMDLAGPEGNLLTGLGLNLMLQGRVEDAGRCFAEADRLAPGTMNTLAQWSKLHEVTGDLDRARELLDKAAAASSETQVNLLRATHLTRAGRPADALALIEAAPALAGHGQLERGRLYDRLGRYDEAWADFIAAKQKLAAEAGGVRYEAAAVEQFFAELGGFFTRDNVALLPSAAVRADVPQPIFIMGAPRSGTTLIEQILASHSTVRAGGELSFLVELRRLAKLLFPEEPFPQNLARTWTADNRHAATVFRDYFLARAERYGLLEPGKAFFTDKTPFNEVWLPMLRMAFPQARVVRLVRHPLDVCVSMLSNHMTHGFNCAYTIDGIVHHLAAVHGLMERYRRELVTGELVLRYETFVADPVAGTRQLLEHLGLPFEESCLRSHENRRYAPTPSYAQVTEKINDRSIGRYRHYVAHLKPFLPQLGGLMAAYGYEP